MSVFYLSVCLSVYWSIYLLFHMCLCIYRWIINGSLYGFITVRAEGSSLIENPKHLFHQQWCSNTITKLSNLNSFWSVISLLRLELICVPQCGCHSSQLSEIWHLVWKLVKHVPGSPSFVYCKNMHLQQSEPSLKHLLKPRVLTDVLQRMLIQGHVSFV